MYNKVFLIGNLTRDPELRYTSSGIPVASFTIAVNRIKKKGAEKSEADFINCVAWRRLAEVCAEYLKKGRPAAVEGRLQLRTYDAKTGEKRTVAEVVIDNMQMLGKKEESVRANEWASSVIEPVEDNDKDKDNNKDKEGEIPF